MTVALKIVEELNRGEQGCPPRMREAFGLRRLQRRFSGGRQSASYPLQEPVSTPMQLFVAPATKGCTGRFVVRMQDFEIAEARQAGQSGAEATAVQTLRDADRLAFHLVFE